MPPPGPAPLEPPPPPPFAHALYRPPPRKPVAITVIGICGIVWSSIALLSTVLALVAIFISADFPNPALDAMLSTRALRIYTIVSTLITVGLAVMLLAGSIGALKLRPWARRMLVRWSVATVVFAIVNQVLNWVWVRPVIEEVNRQQNLPPTMLLASRIMGVCGAVVIGVIAPMVVLYLLARAEVKAAFEQNAPATEPPAP